MQTGPLVSEQEFFESLNLDYPGLEEVRSAVASNDFAAAKHALGNYCRGRTNVPWYFNPHEIDRKIECDLETADRLLEGEVWCPCRNYTFPDAKIDWKYNPCQPDGDGMGCPEFVFIALSRMNHWSLLGKAYWKTGDERYAQCFADQVESFIRECPRERLPPRKGKNWRTLEAGIRTGITWPDAWYRFLLSPAFTDEHIYLFMASWLEHGRHLIAHPTAMNWVLTEMSGLYVAGVLFPELKEAEEWRAFALKRQHDEMKIQILPDGAQFELTSGYQQAVIGALQRIPDVARVVGRYDEIPPDYVATLERMHDYNVFMMTPNRSLPALGDAGHPHVPDLMKRALPYFPDKPEYKWIISGGKEGHAPDHTSHFFDWAGYVIMRSGWEETANYACFDVGPLGFAHAHEDKLSMVIWSYGREILFDGGGGVYDGNSEWRVYDCETSGHNTILVDGLSQWRLWPTKEWHKVDARWATNGKHDFAAGIYDDGYGSEEYFPVTHVRRVLFVKPDMFVVADTLTPKDRDSHSIQARWHLRPTLIDIDENLKSVTTAEHGRSNLAIVPLLTDGLTVRTVSGQREPELLGWVVPKSQQALAKATTVLHEWEGNEVRHLLTLLLPLKEGEKMPVTNVEVAGKCSAIVTFEDGRRFRIEADPDPSGDISVNEI